jgi:hypothetical protein
LAQSIIRRKRCAQQIDEILDAFPELFRRPDEEGCTTLKGRIIRATEYQGEIVEWDYRLRIVVPKAFPAELPRVFELDGNIPKTRSGIYHVNPDGSLCLGSPMCLMLIAKEATSLLEYFQRVLFPFFHAVTLAIRKGGNLIFGDLQHGKAGLVQEYTELFGLRTETQVKQALFLLGIRPRHANRYDCACGCGKYLRKCDFRFKLNEFRRKGIKRRWFRQHYKELILP